MNKTLHNAYYHNDQMPPEKIDKKIYTNQIISGKIHESLEDPVSQTMYDIADSVSDSVHNLGITPNMITTSRLITVVIAFTYFFKQKYYRTTAVLLALCYFGDCLDGHIARKYNKSTKFGDYYDHITDLITYLLSLYFVTTRIDPDFDWLIIILFILLVASMIQIGCEERYLKIMGIEEDSASMSSFTNLCPDCLVDDDELDNLMEFSRLFGVGVYVLLFVLIVWNFDYFEQ